MAGVVCYRKMLLDRHGLENGFRRLRHAVKKTSKILKVPNFHPFSLQDLIFSVESNSWVSSSLVHPWRPPNPAGTEGGDVGRPRTPGHGAPLVARAAPLRGPAQRCPSVAPAEQRAGPGGWQGHGSGVEGSKKGSREAREMRSCS